VASKIAMNAPTMRSAAGSSDGLLERLAMPVAGGVPTVAAGAPADAILLASTAEIEAAAAGLAAVFAGRGQKVEAATADGVLRFQTTDEQTRELLHDVAESASAADTVYTL